VSRNPKSRVETNVIRRSLAVSQLWASSSLPQPIAAFGCLT
jgi:hypothetical protein